MKLSTIRKAVVAAVTVAADLLATGLLHGTAQTVVEFIILGAGAVGVYAVPNKPLPGPSPAHPAAAALTDPPTTSPK
jgi:hypothetical protein